MNFFKKTIILLLTLSGTLFSTVHASTISVTTGLLLDNYVGADGRRISTTDSYGGSSYDNHWMQVNRVIESGTSTLNVTIKSGFVSKNDTNGSGGIKFGDLFLMDGANYETADLCSDGIRVGCNEFTEQTTSTSYSIYSEQSSNQWEYAFDLGGARNDSYANGVNKNGNVRDLSDLNTTINNPQEAYEQSIKSTTQDRQWQAIMSNDYKVDNSVGSGTWNTLIGEDLLMMSFDITGTSLATVDQIALRWAMTCANDIIEVVANLADNTTHIAEPNVVALILVFLTATLFRRKVK